MLLTSQLVNVKNSGNYKTKLIVLLIEMTSVCNCPVAHLDFTKDGPFRRSAQFAMANFIYDWNTAEMKKAQIPQNIKTRMKKAQMKKAHIPKSNHSTQIKTIVYIFSATSPQQKLPLFIFNCLFFYLIFGMFSCAINCLLTTVSIVVIVSLIVFLLFKC